jgi:hypothetical protein
VHCFYNFLSVSDGNILKKNHIFGVSVNQYLRLFYTVMEIMNHDSCKWCYQSLELALPIKVLIIDNYRTGQERRRREWKRSKKDRRRTRRNGRGARRNGRRARRIGKEQEGMEGEQDGMEEEQEGCREAGRRKESRRN